MSDMSKKHYHKEKELQETEQKNRQEISSQETAAVDIESEIEKLKAELEEERMKTAAEREQHLRALADFANYRRRHEEEQARIVQFATQNLIVKILPVIDNFERALESAEQNHSFESLVEGVRLTIKQLRDILDQEGVKQIESVGQQFDPSVHEAVMRLETEEYPENTVVEELQSGYTYGDRVIRPALVKVAVPPSESE